MIRETFTWAVCRLPVFDNIAALMCDLLAPPLRLMRGVFLVQQQLEEGFLFRFVFIAASHDELRLAHRVIECHTD